MTGRNRTIWPPRNMQRIEAVIGMPVLDYLFEGYASTGSTARAAKWLVEDAGVGVDFRTVKDWWTVACRRDPTLQDKAEKARQEWVMEDKRQRHAEKVERRGLLREIGCVRSALAGRHCVVDGAPLPDTPGNKGVTCGGRCLALWIHVRYHLSDEYRAKHQLLLTARALRHPNEYDPSVVAFAERHQRGEKAGDHGRWTLSPLVSEHLQEVMERRRSVKEQWGDLAIDLPEPRALAKLNNRKPAHSG